VAGHPGRRRGRGPLTIGMGRPDVGEEATVELTVTGDMTARLFGQQMHPVYGTAWMVLHVEESGRLLVDRHLSPDEDAAGYRIELTHERPARIGDQLTVTARVVAVDDRECVTEHQVLSPSGVVGQARFVQRYVRRGAFSG
jgi:predicted thioesterase